MREMSTYFVKYISHTFIRKILTYIVINIHMKLGKIVNTIFIHSHNNRCKSNVTIINNHLKSQDYG